MAIRVLFADDQVPGTDAQNRATRVEMVRARADLADPGRSFDEDFVWFKGLIDFLENTKGLSLVVARTFAEAMVYCKDPGEIDVAVIDLSWHGDSAPSTKGRKNKGLELIETLVATNKTSTRHVPIIAFSQNFSGDFELVQTVSDAGAYPIQKDYSEVGKRMLSAAIESLSKLEPRSATEARSPGGSFNPGELTLADLKRVKTSHALVFLTTLVGAFTSTAKYAYEAGSAGFRVAAPKSQVTLAEVTNEDRRPVDREDAPFKVFAAGTVSNADNLYTCLVVDDQNREWVEPGCKKVIGNQFDGVFYLGLENAAASIGKRYKLFAVTARHSFNEYEVLDREAVVSVSTPIWVRRTH